MNLQLKLRSGKHTGKTIEWLQQNQPSYLAWVQENQPKMLEEVVAKPAPPRQEVSVKEIPTTAMVPNLNFYNEGPDPMSVPYLNKMKEIKPVETQPTKNFWED